MYFIHLFSLSLLCNIGLHAQTTELRFQLLFHGQPLALDQPLVDSTGDTLRIETLRFYAGQFSAWENGRQHWSEGEQSWHLLDAAQPEGLVLRLPLPSHTAMQELRFTLGTDSLTNASGVFGGDLDPTTGMYWSWQSGYINFKIEGRSAGCPDRGGEFVYHLGGYGHPWGTSKPVILPVTCARPADSFMVGLELGPMLEAALHSGKCRITSPGAEAARLFQLLTAELKCL